MKAILEFSLPDEAWEHQVALQAMAYYRALKEIDDYLRNRLKHGDPPPDVLEELEAVRRLLRDEAPPGWDDG